MGGFASPQADPDVDTRPGHRAPPVHNIAHRNASNVSHLRFDQHYSRSFNAELADVRNRVLEMGGLVDSQLKKAVEALASQDVSLAEQVIEDDHRVNAMEVELDEECTRIIALRAPAANDLRLAITVIKTITDLERIGDEAERVAKMVLHEDAVGIDPGVIIELQEMGDMVRTMLDQSLDAFARNDADMAFRTTERDYAVDRRYQALTRQLTVLMSEDSTRVGSCIAALWVARALERIGDRSRNIYEYVIYLVGGKDVRHTSVDKMRAAAEAATQEQERRARPDAKNESDDET